MYPIQLLDVEITSACEPGSIGAVIVVVVALVAIRACSKAENCELFVNPPPEASGPYAGDGPYAGVNPLDRNRRSAEGTQKVAERWQLVCGDNAARLPAQRLGKEEQRIASCLAGCSQKLKEASGKS